MRSLSLCGALIVLGLPLAAQEPAGPSGERVLGIGGFFFRARDPVSIARWYERHLGIALTPTSYEEQPWRQEGGPTVFAPFPDTTGYFGARDRPWMINFRVRDLGAMVAQLRAGGVSVVVDPKLYPNGRFARLSDPEGNPIQLWEAHIPVDSRSP